MRAHGNPTRMELIALAARDLALKLICCCPECGAPGYSAAERIAGLPCEECGSPTRESRAEVYRCARCACRTVKELTGVRSASAARCDYCNP